MLIETKPNRRAALRLSAAITVVSLVILGANASTNDPCREPAFTSSTGEMPHADGIRWAIATYGQTTDYAEASILSRAIWVAMGQMTSSDTAVNELASQIVAYEAASWCEPGMI